MADLVDEWKALARTRLVDETDPSASAPRVDVEVTFGFMLLCAVSGLRHGIAGSWAALLGLTSVMLVQELPRAWLARALGRRCKVRLSVLAAQAQIAGAPVPGAAALALAGVGSLCNLLVALAVLGLLARVPAGNTALLLRALALSHGMWGSAQVLPVLPFRRGRSVASRLAPARRLMHAGASVVLNLAMAAFADLASLALLEPLIVLGTFASAAALVLEVAERADERSGIGRLADQADARLRGYDPAAAQDLAERALVGARSPRMRRRLWTTLAWAAIGKHDPFLAHEAIARLPRHALDVHLVAAYLNCCNRVDEAEQLLDEARRRGRRDRETTKLLIDLFVRRGDEGAALALARDDERLLSADDWRAIEAALPGARSARHEV